MLAVTNFEAMNSVFIITNKNNSLSFTIEGLRSSRGGVETINKLQKILQLRSKNDIKLHVEKVRKRGNQIKIGDKEYNLSDLDTREEEIIEELKMQNIAILMIWFLDRN